MNKFDLDNHAVQANELIVSSWKMDRISLKLFEMAISTIDTMNFDGNNKIQLAKQDIFKMFDAEDKNKYGRFREHIRKLVLQVVEVELQNNRIGSIVPITYVEWGLSDSDQLVELHFNEKIMPYLIDLKNNFTTYQIANIIDLNSKYSIILYKLAKLNHWRSNSFFYSVEELRKITDTIKEYSRFEAFERRVIKEPIEEINKARTDILMTYKKIKSGRSVIGIEFKIRERLSHRDTDFHRPKPIKTQEVSSLDVDPDQLSIYDI